MTVLWFVNVEEGKGDSTSENMSPLVSHLVWSRHTCHDSPANNDVRSQDSVCIHICPLVLVPEMNSFTSVQSNSLNGLLLWNVFLCEARGRNNGIKSII